MNYLIEKLYQRSLTHSLVRLAVASSWPRRILNMAYLRMTPYQRSAFHSHFAKIFRNSPCHIEEGMWRINFSGKTILLPLDSEKIWLEWDSAVSIIGHDIDVKETYRHLIESTDKPDLFIDIGGNYGTHSLLFLVHGVATITFEPNSLCNHFFRLLCDLNGLKPNLQSVALGERHGFVELSYPARDTWHGSTDTKVINGLAANHELITERVEQKKLDDYLPSFSAKNMLIKIDTEGNELTVLKGAIETLKQFRPKVIFESCNAEDRIALFDYFTLHDYQIRTLPLSSAASGGALGYDIFKVSTSSNFMATPK